jgi:hypothetical protein
MRKVGLIAVALCMAAWADAMQEAKLIMQKMDRLAQTRIAADVPFAVYDPFKRVKPLIQKARAVTRLAPPSPMPRPAAILDHKAFMAGRWVHAGQRIGRFTVVRVAKNGVWLREGQKKLLFSPLYAKKRKLLKVKDAR